jgi:uncharacterized protein (TIGR00255 family)
MIHSMTGYAAVTAKLPRGSLLLELRSVNARFLDLQFRIPDELRALEPVLREQLAARLARGKVDCRLSLNDSDKTEPEGALNPQVLDELARLEAAARRAFPAASPLRLADVLRWPGVLAESAIDEQATRSVAQKLCGEALDQFVAARAREGEKLAAAIRARITEMRRRLAEVAPLVPEAIAAYQEKIATRLREAIGSADDERVRAELAVFGMKADVDEELTRLAAHMGEVERVIDASGAAGKRLDFLMQELNREANTLASKAVSQRIADCALELKLLIEQMREQVQNIE